MDLKTYSLARKAGAFILAVGMFGAVAVPFTVFADDSASVSVTSINGQIGSFSSSCNASFSNPVNIGGGGAIPHREGKLTQYSVVVAWGDGTTSTVTPTFKGDANNDFTFVAGPHTYSNSSGLAHTVVVSLHHQDNNGNDNFDATPGNVCIQTPQFTITPSAGANGTISPNTVQTVLAGNSQAFTFSPAAGFQVSDISIDGGALQATTTTTYTFYNVETDHTILVDFSVVATPPPPPTTGTLIIVKNTTGGDGMFTFTVTGDINSPESITTHDDTGSTSSITLGTGSVTITENSASGFSFSNVSCTDGGNTFQDNPNLDAQSDTFTLTTGDTVTCTFTNALIPPPPGMSDLSVNKTVDDATPLIGGTVAYSITATNAADGSDDTNVVVNDLLPAGLTLTSYTGTGTYNTNSGVWSIGDLPAGTSANLTITATVDAATAGETIINTATISGSNTDPNTNNNTSSADITVGCPEGQHASADHICVSDTGTLTIVKDTTGGDGTFTFTVTNDPNSTESITTTGGIGQVGPITLPAGSETVTETGTPGFNFGSVSCVDNGTTIGGANGMGDTFTLVTGHTVTCTFSNSAVPPPASDLSITKTVANSAPTTGGTAIYTITATNGADSSADTSVSVNDLLPSGLTFASDTASVGSYDSGSGVWTIGDLAVGGSATLTLNAIVGTDTAGDTITNTASVSGANADPDEDNNTASIAITVGCLDGQHADGDHICVPDTGTVTIVKDVTGGTDGTFTFNVPGQNEPVSLTTSSGTDSSDPITVTATSSVTVSENAADGFTFSSVSCADGDTTVGTMNSDNESDTFPLTSGENVTCTFTNAVQVIPPTTGTLTIVKDTTGGDGDFAFNVTGEENPESITTQSGTGSVGPITLTPGDITVTENSTSGFNFSSVSCTDNNGPIGSTDVDGNGDEFSLTAGDNVTCTFNNTAIATPTPPKNNSGGNDGISGQIINPPQGQVLGAATSTPGVLPGGCVPLINTYLELGKNNNVSDVTKLQKFLNDLMGANLPVTGFYGPLTFKAVENFQVKYYQDVLNPWLKFGLATNETPTGYVYKTTKWKLNDLYCTTLDAPFPDLP